MRWKKATPRRWKYRFIPLESAIIIIIILKLLLINNYNITSGGGVFSSENHCDAHTYITTYIVYCISTSMIDVRRLVFDRTRKKKYKIKDMRIPPCPRTPTYPSAHDRLEHARHGEITNLGNFINAVAATRAGGVDVSSRRL